MHQSRIGRGAIVLSFPLLFSAPCAHAQSRDSAASFIAQANAPLTKFPVRLSRSSAASLHVQILLDLAHF